MIYDGRTNVYVYTSCIFPNQKHEHLFGEEINTHIFNGISRNYQQLPRVSNISNCFHTFEISLSLMECLLHLNCARLTRLMPCRSFIACVMFLVIYSCSDSLGCTDSLILTMTRMDNNTRNSGRRWKRRTKILLSSTSSNSARNGAFSASSISSR